MVSGVLAQRVAAHGHGFQVGDGAFVVTHLVVGKANLVLQRRLNLAFVNGGILIKVLGGVLVLPFLVIGITKQQLDFV